MKKAYSFITNWEIPAPLELVWNAVYHSENWPEWWAEVKQVREIVQGDKDGIGSLRNYIIKSPAGYHLEFQIALTEYREQQLLKGAVSGDLEGSGTWSFKELSGITYASCVWEVYTTLKWMNRFSFILSPFFSWCHSFVMRRGEEQLKKKLKDFK